MGSESPDAGCDKHPLGCLQLQATGEALAGSIDKMGSRLWAIVFTTAAGAVAALATLVLK